MCMQRTAYVMLVTCALPAVGSDSERYSHVIYIDPRYKVCTCAIQIRSTHFVIHFLCGGIPNTPHIGNVAAMVAHAQFNGMCLYA